jgi:hypothetical protein
MKCPALVTGLLAYLAPQSPVIKRSIVAIASEYQLIGMPSAEPGQLFHATISKRSDMRPPVLCDCHRGCSGLQIDVLPLEIQQVSYPQSCVETKDDERGHLPPFLINDPSDFDEVIDLFRSEIFVGVDGFRRLFDASCWGGVGAG